MSSKDIINFFDKEVLDIEDIIQIAFSRYKELKDADELYSSTSFIPQNLIKLYYSEDSNHSSFEDIIDNFKNKYIEQESILEGVHSIEEINGLGLVYDFIRSDEWKSCPNIYIILLIHLKLFSLTPYKEFGGKLRNSNCYISNSNVNTCPYNQINIEISSLYQYFNELLNKGVSLNNDKGIDNEDKLIEYINECLKLKCRLIEIHPFIDGNGRTMRALTNLLFKLATLPPVYVREKERDAYLKAMSRAIVEKDYNDINQFYYYKICDSILELDIDKRINKSFNRKVLKKDR